eukprot:GHVP01059977.1.p1 GENE.GHVP01059977.1~~GHVP01059977.1.p1  ORF type:complete len:240 (+),score=29.12 GHVP01059977.1:3-722(+)
MSTYTIILPTYNESHNIAIAMYYIIQAMGTEKYKILIIDDKSLDGTPEIVQNMMDAYPKVEIQLKQRESKLGLGSAYKFAAQFVDSDFVIIMDSDLSHHPKYIPEFIKEQKKSDCDIVTGTRYSGRGGGVHGWSVSRKITSRVANTICNVILGSSSTDLTGSFRLYRTSVFRSLIQLCTSRRFFFQIEIMFHAFRNDLKIKEYPISFVNRVYGESKFSTKEVSEFGKGIFRLLTYEEML